MLLEKLSKYAERIELASPMYQETPVAWVVELDQHGRFQGFVRTTGDAATKRDRGKRLLAPHVGRSSGIRAKLLADTGEYVLGIPRPKSGTARVTDCHRAFLEEVRKCAGATGEPTVKAVLRFLEDNGGKAAQPPAEFDPADNMTFRVEGVLPIHLASVQRYWAEAASAVAETGATGKQFQCLVCGKVRPAVRRLPFKIKGIPGGQPSGTALISANAPAFESFGLEESLIAPTCEECGERFSKAANSLIQGEKSHIRVGPLVYIFWTREDTGFYPATILSNPEAEDVQGLLRSAATGKAAATHIDSTPFYATAFGASGGRVAVRDWVDTTVEQAKRNLARWFRLQELVERDGSSGRPLGVYALALSTVREAKDLTADIPQALVRGALHGGRLAASLLERALRRCRAEGAVTRPRAALVKMVLLSQAPDSETEDKMNQLEPTNRNPAYVCGRLLAVLESVQLAALGKTNATIIDRFFGTASSAPASVFGNLLRGSQSHLSKLRRTKPGAYIALQQRLEETAAPLEAFPQVLSLQEQGLFTLGYYHQRAADHAQAKAHRAARQHDHQTEDVSAEEDTYEEES